MSTNYTTLYGGYTCANCGCYVPHGFSHQCQWPASRPATDGMRTSVDHGFQYEALLRRIAEALEDIAKALGDGSLGGRK